MFALQPPGGAEPESAALAAVLDAEEAGKVDRLALCAERLAKGDVFERPFPAGLRLHELGDVFAVAGSADDVAADDLQRPDRLLSVLLQTRSANKPSPMPNPNWQSPSTDL